MPLFEASKENAIKTIMAYQGVSYSIARSIYSMQSIKKKKWWRQQAYFDKIDKKDAKQKKENGCHS